VATTQGENPPAASQSRLGITGLLRLGLLALVGLAIVALASLLPFGQQIISDANRRNQQDLVIAAGGLETWSTAVGTVARANFIKGMVKPLEVGQPDYADKWRHLTRLRHPIIGDYRILYAVTTRDGCSAIREETARKEGRRLPFVKNRYSGGSDMLKVVDSFPLDTIWRGDMRSDIADATPEAIAAYLKQIVGDDGAGDTATLSATGEARRALVICYGVVIPLDRLLVIDEAARDFTNLLIVDPQGKIISQIGTSPLSTSSLEALKPEDSAGWVASLASAAQQKPAPALSEKNSSKLTDRTEPVDVTIGGRTMVAYVRAFHPPAGSFPACVRKSDKASAADRPNPIKVTATNGPNHLSLSTAPPETKATDGGSDAECHVVALMPKALIWQQLVRPPAATLTWLALALSLALVLLPALRIILLGPREAISRVEAVGVVLGLLMAASLVVIAVLFAIDLTVHRSAVAARADRIAERATQEAVGRLNAAKVTLATALYGPAPPPGAATCPAFRYGHSPDTGYEDCRRKIGLCSEAAFAADGLPRIESLSLYDDNGNVLTGTPRACRAPFGGRAQLAGRTYFQRARSNDFGDRDGLMPPSIVKAGEPSPILWPDAKSALPLYLGQVMSQPDGLNKTILAVGLKPPPKPQYDPQGEQEPRVFAVATTVLPELLTPAVLPPYHLLVIDSSDEALPVIMHPASNHMGIESFAAMIDNAGEVREALSTLASGRSWRFAGFYDGGPQQFVARRIPNTHWVALVYHSGADIDRLPTRTAGLALLAWAIIGILVAALWTLALIVEPIALLRALGRRVGLPLDPQAVVAEQHRRHERGWARLWPQEGNRNCETYRTLARDLGIAAAASLMVGAVAGYFGAPPALLLLAALFVAALMMVFLFWQLGKNRQTPSLGPDTKRPPTSRRLRPETQKRFLRMFLAAQVCLAMMPSVAIWWDAHSFSRERQRRHMLDELIGADGALTRANQGLERIHWAFGADAGVRPPSGYKAFSYQIGEQPDKAPTAPRESDSFAATLWKLYTGAEMPAAIGGCVPPADGDGDDDDAAPEVIVCTKGATDGPASPGPGIYLRPVAAEHFYKSGIDLALIFMGSALVAALLVYVGRRTLRSLAGFGIAIEAWETPRLDLRAIWQARPKPATAAGAQAMAAAAKIEEVQAKSLLVNAPWSLEPMLTALNNQYHDRWHIERLDISTLRSRGLNQQSLSVSSKQIWLVSGLELVLADPSRRLGALGALETLIRHHDDQPKGSSYLLFLTATAPMDRILDAYEREHPETRTIDTQREHLRWGRVFEAFATFQFRPIQVTRYNDPPAGMIAHLNGDEQTAILTVFDELRWLSPLIINGCINEDVTISPERLKHGMVPIWQEPASSDPDFYAKLPADDDQAYPYFEMYQQPILAWALARKFPSPEAAVAAIRGQLIEHYQRQWSSSTLAERLVLHHLAFGRFVNIASSLGFASLVRRGLVIMDPEPRLINESFASFVRQAEKLDRIRDWQALLPESGWIKSRLPILITLALGVAALLALALFAGIDIRALLPLLAAGAPALVATTQRLFRPS